MIYFKIIGGVLIQTSDKKLLGFDVPIVEENTLEEKEGFTIQQKYEIVGNRVKITYEYQEIIEGDIEDEQTNEQ